MTSSFHTWVRCWSRSTTSPIVMEDVCRATSCLPGEDKASHPAHKPVGSGRCNESSIPWSHSWKERWGYLTYPMTKDRQHQGPPESRVPPQFLSSASTPPQPGAVRLFILMFNTNMFRVRDIERLPAGGTERGMDARMYACLASSTWVG